MKETFFVPKKAQHHESVYIKFRYNQKPILTKA